jgi:hypothetical protein
LRPVLYGCYTDHVKQWIGCLDQDSYNDSSR